MGVALTQCAGAMETDNALSSANVGIPRHRFSRTYTPEILRYESTTI